MTEPAEILTHRLEGSGDTILLLNGGFMTFATWEPVVSHLSESHQLLFCDLRGQILSPGASHADLDGNVRDVEALLDHLGLEQVHVLGTSFGAFVGVRLAAKRPERVLSMIAATATDIATPDMVLGVAGLRRVLADIIAGGDPGQFHDLLLKDVYSSEFVASYREALAARRSQMRKLPKAWFAGLEGILTCTENLDLRSDLGKVRCPTLLVIAARDEVIPPHQSRAMAAAIPEAQLVEHPTSGHALVAEDPQWLGQQVQTFLQGMAARSIPAPCKQS
jgi:pimeloyl-ACP methyl ester carboxylesterase